MRRFWVPILVLGALLSAPGCAGRDLDLELQASVLYDKPRIDQVRYDVVDERRDGGGVQVTVEFAGDGGLTATFDISPGIASRQPMREISGGLYRGEFKFPDGIVGGPYTVTGRLRHAEAGEVSRPSPAPLTIGLIR